LQSAAEPLRVDVIDELADALRRNEVELRFMESLALLRGVWATSLHASGIGLCNAVGWPES